ncbi:glycosyltransferase [Schlesneria paludicola]|uniref:glycosyltransferase n=1 Tax=Schlesneria paludicola TaxID=360056 RepID=UPI00029A4250|nr:glycosyltransferase [Schlesneria paludicola]
MRRILFTTFGSYGDLNPYIAMARVFKANGDQVTIATHTHYREQVERVGIRFVPVKPGEEELGPPEVWTARANHPLTGSQFVVRSLVLPFLQDSYRTIKEIAPEHDLIVSHVLTFAGPIVAEELGIPWISTVLQPSVYFSAYDPPKLGFFNFLPRLKFLGPRFMGWLLGTLVKQTNPWFEPVARLRSQIGLPPSSKNPLIHGHSPYGCLALFSKEFAPAQPDWPPNLRQVGFPLYDEETSSELSADLQAFLDGGPAPVVFTLGSTIVTMETPYYEIAYKAVKALGLRAVFLVGKTPHRIPPAAVSDPQILISPYEPFSHLFPKAAAIVHQCGVGTTAQALTSGRPQVMVPFAHDQPDNAQRVATLGCGVTISSRRLTTPRLIAALKEVLQEPSFAERARHVGTRLQAEDFGHNLRGAIEEFLSGL